VGRKRRGIESGSPKKSVPRGDAVVTGRDTERWAGPGVGVGMLFSEWRDRTLRGCGRSGAVCTVRPSYM
jgi:hypothetical protein